MESVNDMVYRPKENRSKRDKLSENLTKMIEESNRFRNHQAREILIHWIIVLRYEEEKIYCKSSQIKNIEICSFMYELVKRYLNCSYFSIVQHSVWKWKKLRIQRNNTMREFVIMEVGNDIPHILILITLGI